MASPSFQVSRDLQSGVDEAFQIAGKILSEGGEILFLFFPADGQRKFSLINNCQTQDEVLGKVRKWASADHAVPWFVQVGMATLDQEEGPVRVIIAHAVERTQKHGVVLFQKLTEDAGGVLRPCSPIDFLSRLPNDFFADEPEHSPAPRPPDPPPQTHFRSNQSVGKFLLRFLVSPILYIKFWSEPPAARGAVLCVDSWVELPEIMTFSYSLFPGVRAGTVSFYRSEPVIRIERTDGFRYEFDFSLPDRSITFTDQLDLELRGGEGGPIKVCCMQLLSFFRFSVNLRRWHQTFTMDLPGGKQIEKAGSAESESGR